MEQALGCPCLVGWHVASPTFLKPPRGCEADRKLPLPGQRLIDTPPHLAFHRGLRREQNSDVQLAVDPVGLDAVWRQRTWWLVVPVPAQRHRDGRTGRPLICPRIHDENRLMRERLPHEISMSRALEERTHIAAASGASDLVDRRNGDHPTLLIPVDATRHPVLGDWKEEYNHDRPHSSLGYRTPRAYAAICTH